MRIKVILSFALLLLIVATGRAQQSEGAAPLEAGAYQVELYHATAWADGARDRYTELLLRGGLRGGAEYWVICPSFSHSHVDQDATHAYGHLALGYKHLLAAGDEVARRPDISVFATLAVPHADQLGRTARWDLATAFAFGWTLPADLALDANLGWAHVHEGDEEAYTLLRGSLCLTRSWTDSFSTYLELAGDAPLKSGIPDCHFVNAGFTVAVSPKLDITLGGGVSLRGNPRPTLIDATVTHRF